MSIALSWPMVFALVAIGFAPALLFATTLLEHLIALPLPDRSPLGPQKSDSSHRLKGKVRLWTSSCSCS